MICPHSPGEFCTVAPLAGAWIEITKLAKAGFADAVAPLAGAWIEINLRSYKINVLMVAPLAGAWIEIFVPLRNVVTSVRRSPRGSVD